MVIIEKVQTKPNLPFFICSQDANVEMAMGIAPSPRSEHRIHWFFSLVIYWLKAIPLGSLQHQQIAASGIG